MVEHRVSMRGGVLHRADDPARSSDPRVRNLVAALGRLEVTPPPREHFRAELRAQLVAVTPRLVNEGMAGLVRHTPDSLATAHVRPSRWHILSVRAPRVQIGKPVRLATAALTVLVLLLSGAVWLSRSALPGDPLYNLKRAGEDAQLSLASGTGKASDLLAFAKTRVDEVADLLSIPSASGTGLHADGAVGSHTASLITSTLGSADDDLRQAANLLDTKAVRSDSPAPLQTMIHWAPGQRSRLDRIVAHIPAGRLHTRAVSSRELVVAALLRAEALRAGLTCGCPATGTDQLGPLPCSSCPEVSTVLPGGTGQPSSPHSPGTVPAAPQVQQQLTGTQGSGSGEPAPTDSTSGSPSGTTTGTGGTKNPAGTGTSSGSGLPNLPSLPGGTALPSLPFPPQPPVTVNSCSITVTLGPIGLGLGTCGPHLGS